MLSPPPLILCHTHIQTYTPLRISFFLIALSLSASLFLSVQSLSVCFSVCAAISLCICLSLFISSLSNLKGVLAKPLRHRIACITVFVLTLLYQFKFRRRQFVILTTTGRRKKKQRRNVTTQGGESVELLITKAASWQSGKRVYRNANGVSSAATF